MPIQENANVGPVDGIAVGKLSTDAVGNFYIRTEDGHEDIPPAVAKALNAFDLVADAQIITQTVDILPTVLNTPDVAGLFRLSVYVCTSGAGATGATLAVNLSWTDSIFGRNENIISGFPLDASGFAHVVVPFYSAGGSDIIYSAAMTGAGGESEDFSLFMALERLI